MKPNPEPLSWPPRLSTFPALSPRRPSPALATPRPPCLCPSVPFPQVSQHASSLSAVSSGLSLLCPRPSPSGPYCPPQLGRQPSCFTLSHVCSSAGFWVFSNNPEDNQIGFHIVEYVENTGHVGANMHPPMMPIYAKVIVLRTATQTMAAECECNC